MATTTKSTHSKLLLLGDSLTQTSFHGWGGGLAERYQRRADVINRGMSGYNSRWYLEYAETSGDVWDEPGNIVLVTIFFGANDASLLKENPRHHVPLSEYQDNLRTLIQKSRDKYPQAKILLISPPPVYHEKRLEFQKQRYGDKATGVLERTLESAGEYAAACRQVAEESKVPCLDLYTTMVDEKEDGGFGKFLSDGLHFSQTGHDFVLKGLLGAIEKEFPDLYVTPDAITGQPNNSGSTCPGISSSGPYHDHIDHTQWKAAFASEPEAKRQKTE